MLEKFCTIAKKSLTLAELEFLLDTENPRKADGSSLPRTPSEKVQDYAPNFVTKETDYDE